MQARAADAADVHAGAFPDRLEAFEDGDVLGGVIRGHLAKDYKDFFFRGAAFFFSTFSVVVAVFRARLALR